MNRMQATNLTVEQRRDFALNALAIRMDKDIDEVKATDEELDELEDEDDELDDEEELDEDDEDDFFFSSAS